MISDLPPSLVSAVRAGRVSLFLGAGASQEAGFPGAFELSAHLADVSNHPEMQAIRDRPLDQVCQRLYMLPGFGKGWVRNRIIEYFTSETRKVSKPPSEAHSLITGLEWRTIFTTNYDRLVEIAYDSADRAAQSILPVFAPDDRLLRRDASQVRLIKLNGSVDEAARNTAHELVVTFSEQQASMSRNKQFYDFLYEEAINGPIVFVGFRFHHPGAYLPGTSPEFLLLTQLLRNMGQLAEWHYCVTPVRDGNSDDLLAVQTLRDSRVEVVPGTFGEFTKLLAAHLRVESVEGTVAHSFNLPIGNRQMPIKLDELTRDRLHFELLTSRIDTLDTPSLKDSLNGDHNWSSIKSHHFLERDCKSEFRRVLETHQNSGHDLLFFVAPTGWGKTILLKDLAYEFYEMGHPILWLNPYATIEYISTSGHVVTGANWDADRINDVLRRINEFGAENRMSAEQYKPIIIADNCVERATDVLSLYLRLAKERRDFILIITMREYEYDQMKIDTPMVASAKVYSPPYADAAQSQQEVRRLIDFCAERRIASFENIAHRETVARQIVHDEAENSLLLALQVIFDRQHRPFSEIVEGLWNAIKGEKGREIVLRVSSLHQYGGLFSPRLFTLIKSFPREEQALVTQEYRTCIETGLLVERLEQDEPCVQTIHSLVAERFVRIAADRKLVDVELVSLIEAMTPNARDIEVMRRLIKRTTDYSINLSTEPMTRELYITAARASDNDWVICQQFSKYLINRQEFPQAEVWASAALKSNPDYRPLLHTLGNVYRRWGMSLRGQGLVQESESKFELAGDCFARSRLRGQQDEYGYVTHLDMLAFMISNEANELRRATLISEGVKLYSEAIQVVPQTRYNFILNDRYKHYFDLDGERTYLLAKQIVEAMDAGVSTVQSALYLAALNWSNGEEEVALRVLARQRAITNSNAELWAKEAEYQTRLGRLEQAARAIDSARRAGNSHDEVSELQVMYWDSVVSTVLEEYLSASRALTYLRNAINKTGLPRGYIWYARARAIDPRERNFRNHARIWRGRIDDVRTLGGYGRITLTNSAGENVGIPFNPRYWSRSDFRRGEPVEFVIALVADGLRAEDPDSKPLKNTELDVFLQK